MKTRNMLDIKDVQKTSYRDCHWEQVRDFPRTNWREDHPISKRKLFDWQFRGFGNENNKINSLILSYHNEVIGFRGIIPGLYQVPSEKGKIDIIQGGSLTMWMIKKDFRGRGLGLAMHLEAQNMMAVITGAGSNPKTSVPIYLNNGFSVLDSMNRYVLPLDVLGYLQLLSQKVNISYIREWTESLKRYKQSVEPSEPDIDEIAAVWKETTFPLRIFSLYRNAEFYRWRYLNSTGFRYLFFGDASDTGMVIARTEVICSDEDKGLNGQKVFRIIEILPRTSKAWKAETDTALIELIQGTIQWAVKQGCLAADFYCSTSRFESILKLVGFREYDTNFDTPICSLASLFQPLKYIAEPINALFRIDIPGKGLIDIDFEDTYMVKSENDMDRPAI